MIQTDIIIPRKKAFETGKESTSRVAAQKKFIETLSEIFKDHFGEDCFNYIIFRWSNNFFQIKKYQQRESGAGTLAQIQRGKDFKLTHAQFEKIQNHIADQKGAARLKERQTQTYAEFKKTIDPMIEQYKKQGVHVNYIVTGGMGTLMITNTHTVELNGRKTDYQLTCDIYPTAKSKETEKIDIHIDQSKGFDYVLAQVQQLEPVYTWFKQQIQQFKQNIPAGWWIN